jgi:hypothetical protein
MDAGPTLGVFVYGAQGWLRVRRARQTLKVTKALGTKEYHPL